VGRASGTVGSNLQGRELSVMSASKNVHIVLISPGSQWASPSCSTWLEAAECMTYRANKFSKEQNKMLGVGLILPVW
jgi:hypothetical protein